MKAKKQKTLQEVIQEKRLQSDKALKKKTVSRQFSVWDASIRKIEREVVPEKEERKVPEKTKEELDDEAWEAELDEMYAKAGLDRRTDFAFKH